MRARRISACMALAGLLLAGCSAGRRAPSRLVIGVGRSLILGPANPVWMQRNANTWETLTELDGSLTPRPALAESWEVSPDGRRWTLRLRAGVLFHNGDRLSPALVAANIRRLKQHPELDYYGTFPHLSSVEPAGDRTVVLEFSKPLVDLPNKLGHYFAGIFSPAAFGEDGRLSRPVGSGPYVFAGSRTGEYELVRAFENYHGGRPFFDEVEFRIITDPVVRIMSLIRGDIDMIVHHGGVPAVHLNLLRNRPEIVVDSSEVAITHYLLFNAARRPFNERGCRACFDRLVDRTEIVERILQGAGTPARDFLVEKAYRWNRGRFSPRADSSGDALRRLAACTAGKPLVLLLNQSDTGAWTYRHLADYLADYFTRRGIAIRVEALESGAWQAATDAGRFDLALYPLSAPTGTPELLIRRLAYSRGLPARSASNTTHFSSPSLDRLFEEAVYAPTAGEHERRFNQLLDLLAEEKPFVPLYHERYFYAYRRGFTEVQVDPFLKLDLARLRASGPFR